MNRLARTIAATALIFAGSTACTAAPTVKIGEPAPGFSESSANKKTVKLEDYKGKKVVLEWLNHSCPFVKKHYSGGNMQKLQKQAADEGTVWLSVISSAPGKQGFSTPEQAMADVKTKGASPTAVLLDEDGSLGKLYGAKTTPTMAVIDEKGILRYFGAIDDNSSTNPADIPNSVNYVTSALNAMKNGKAIETPYTQAYGCSVKY